MKKLISAQIAGNILLISMALLIIFHILILLKVVPSDIIWGSQITDTSTSLATLETISLFVTLVFTIIIAAKMGHI